MTPTARLIWEEKVDAQTKALLFLMNSKNKIVKKDIRLAFAQGNHSAYLDTIKSMMRFPSSQYNIKNVNNNPCDKKRDKNGKKSDEAKSEKKITATQALKVHAFEKK